MDTIDEFEFKPLSQGLGFHKKQQAPHSATATPRSAEPISRKTSVQYSPNPTAADPLITPPLPRKSYPLEKKISPPLPPPTSAKIDPVEDILKTLHKNKNYSFNKTSAEKHKVTTNSNVSEKTKGDNYYSLSPWLITPSILDAMLVTAITLLAMILVLTITKVDLIRVLTTSESDPSVYAATLLLFSTMSFIYLFGSRLILGATPGEWSYDLRIGNPQKQNSMDYLLQVLARTLLVILTGFVFFPLVSILFGKDILGRLTGAALYRKN